MRTRGTRNIKPFGERNGVPTSSSANLRHLSSTGGNPLEQFTGLLNHQASFLLWVDKRHEAIVALKKEIITLKKLPAKKGAVGAKAATFVKYRWYAEHLVLLEGINAFEAFYKNTFTKLGAILRPFVQPDPERVVPINARLLWAIAGETVLPDLVPTLVFEHQLFHDLDEVDKATDMLVGKRRYNRKTKQNPLADRVRAIRGIFQIRHTLSHNSGVVTKSDQAKFADLGFTLAKDEVIDPVKERLCLAVFKELEKEAGEFTLWLRQETAAFLSACIADRGLAVPAARRTELEALLGADACWAGVDWT
jgi:hypothetical protein